MSLQGVRLEEEEEEEGPPPKQPWATVAEGGKQTAPLRGTEDPCNLIATVTTSLCISTRKEKEPTGHPETRKVSSVTTVCF